MTDLTLHQRPVGTVFDLLGDKENDITYALGWAFANSPALVGALLKDVASELGVREPGEPTAVRLQEPVVGRGFTDLEIETNRLHLILEAKAGWEPPEEPQLKKYANSFREGLTPVFLITAQGSPEFAAGKYPRVVRDRRRKPIKVLYRSWEEVVRLAEGVASGRGADKRLVRELVHYLKGLVSMQDVRDNMVYVVSLGGGPVDWAPIPPREIVLDRRRHFHPVGGRRGGWPKDPPNYLGFRFDGRLQQICHVEKVVVTEHPHEHIPNYARGYDFGQPFYLYHLGPPIEPPRPVLNGKVTRALRVWAALDLLLTCKTISQARDKTNRRLEAAGQ